MGAYWTIPTLRTYADALKHYESVKPMRGDKNFTKPIGSRKYKYMSIYQNEVDKSIYCKKGGSTLVEYRTDGAVIVPRRLRYSTAEFTRSVLGTDIVVEFNTYWIKCNYEADGETRHGYQSLRHVQENEFRREPDNTLTFVNPVFTTIHTIDRKKANKIMKPYLPFLKYAQGMVKLKDGAFPREEIAEHVDATNRFTHIEILPLIDGDNSNQLKALYMLVSRANANRWGVAYMTQASVRQTLRDVVYLHYQETVGDLLNEETITDGRRVKDENYRLHLAAQKPLTCKE